MASTKTPHLVLFASIFLGAPLAVLADDDPASRAQGRQQIAALAKGDAAGAYRLALELEGKGYAELAKSAYGRVIDAEPDHAAARRALGYERVGGRWLTGDDLLRAKGLVLSGGRWVLAQEVRPPDANLPRMRKAATGLQSTRSADRIAAAQEIARIGDKRGIPILVGAWARSASRAVGGYFAQSRQLAYVQDFEVEVA